MKANFNRTAFTEALNLVGSVVPSRTPKPILKCVRITTSENQAHLFATDLEIGIIETISEVEIEKPGEVVIPADRLVPIVRESADEVLALKVKDSVCEIEGSDSHFTIYGYEAKDYPVIPGFEDPPSLEIKLSDLQSGIEQCLFATAKESTRYALNGVLWEVRGKKLSLVATDGRRLARSKVKILRSKSDEFEKKKVIIPAKTMALLDRIGGDDDTVSVKLVGNQVLIKCSTIVICSNLVEGNFPNYEDIIPKDHDKKLKLSTEAVLSAVRRSALLTSEESRGVKISISGQVMEFSSRAPEAGDARITMPVDYKGASIEVGFNPQFLIDVFRTVKAADFELELGQPDRPGLIKSGPDFLCVLMPINLG